MGKIDDGGSAFPLHEGQENYAGDGLVRIVTTDPGMSLRDYFAAVAVTGTAAPDPMQHDETPAQAELRADRDARSLARWAYRMADAMLATRTAKPQEQQ